MWYHHWGDCGLHDWIIKFLMALGVLTHVLTHTHAQKSHEWVGGRLGSSNWCFWCLILYSATFLLSVCPSQPFLLPVSIKHQHAHTPIRFFFTLTGLHSPTSCISPPQAAAYIQMHTHTHTHTKMHKKEKKSLFPNCTPSLCLSAQHKQV